MEKKIALRVIGALIHNAPNFPKDEWIETVKELFQKYDVSAEYLGEKAVSNGERFFRIEDEITVIMDEDESVVYNHCNPGEYSLPTGNPEDLDEVILKWLPLTELAGVALSFLTPDFVKPTVEQVQKAFSEDPGNLIQMKGYYEMAVNKRNDGHGQPDDTLEEAAERFRCKPEDILEYTVRSEDDYHLSGETFYITLKKK